jgi:predicted YcjX-like family ATPase
VTVCFMKLVEVDHFFLKRKREKIITSISYNHISQELCLVHWYTSTRGSSVIRMTMRFSYFSNFSWNMTLLNAPPLLHFLVLCFFTIID